MKTQPPRWAQRLLEYFCDECLFEEIEGDLQERFQRRLNLLGEQQARRQYILEALGFVRSFAFKRKPKTSSSTHLFSADMIRNYFKLAFRSLLNQKVTSFINIGGLAVGMAFATLIGLWVQYEMSFDSFHPNGDRIALVMKHTLFNGQKKSQEVTPLPLFYELQNNYPEVKRISRMDLGGQHSLSANGNSLVVKDGAFVDPDFLEMFDFPVAAGTAKTALKDPYSIVLTRDLAKALFGKANPIGKIVKLDNAYDIQVTGIVEALPKNSSIQFDFLVPFEFGVAVSDFLKNNKTNWGNNFLKTVVELKEGSDMQAFSKKIGPLNVQKDKSLKNQTLFLHPLSQWHLRGNYVNWVNTGGKIVYVRLFAIIGIVVLLIACINFMNLSTARSEKRAKEVGVRKAVGSAHIQLVLQFLCESVLTAFIAFLVSLLLIKLIMPQLKDLGFENVHFDLNNFNLLGSVLLICLFTGVLSGSYPAFYLSSFKPVLVLKGKFSPGNRSINVRKVLVVSQFAVSIGLIISTVIVYKQISYARDRPVGYRTDNLISIDASKDLTKNFVPLKQDLLNSGFIEAVSKASQPMTRIYNRWSDFSWTGKEPGSDIALDALMTEWDFEKAAGLKFKQGRPFSKEYKTDSNAVILNEAALKVIGYKDPVGKTMRSGDRVITIVGIVENLILEDPYQPVYPLAILFNPEAVNNIFLRLKPGSDLKKTLAEVQAIFKRYSPSMPFEYSFVDQEFDKKFATENQVGKLAAILAGIAIFISCLGLYGLASFTAEQRTKEMGIRKVLGASFANLFQILSKEFIVLILISCLISIPIAWYFMNDWLRKYYYRTEISWWIFAASGLGALCITLLTVSFQSIKAALVNPVKSLRSE
ncbi:ABC transporter permease [Dyadobacter sp. LJ53]|uniref:ABC transporter permease n=1 Tax=Dyadobacter chenwenxiniae TaxID=2906456 RepID=UPI001F1D6A70|nr:ABC transporter permease [Dyadobacter chenwenxiniae]MCF0049327.1 ABC transporter permease [Dyadobacter chenwenxiniae]